MGDWKGVRPKQNGPIELFDLQVDVGEKTNVAAQHPDVAKKIEGLMTAAHVDNPNFPVRAAGAARKK